MPRRRMTRRMKGGVGNSVAGVGGISSGATGIGGSGGGAAEWAINTYGGLDTQLTNVNNSGSGAGGNSLHSNFGTHLGGSRHRRHRTKRHRHRRRHTKRRKHY